MGRQKLVRFDENKENPLVVEPGKPLFDSIKGNWKSTFFKNNHPLVLELGCGRGEYTVGLAGIFREKNFVGVDIKGGRIWKGATVGRNEGLNNVGFLRVKIENVPDHFGTGEVNEIWITFPDPRPKERDQRRRLTSPRFLEIYQQIMPKGGIIHLKTDDDSLYAYTLSVISRQNLTMICSTNDLYHSDLLTDHLGLVTTYEKRWLGMGKKIKYVRYQL